MLTKLCVQLLIAVAQALLQPNQPLQLQLPLPQRQMMTMTSLPVQTRLDGGPGGDVRDIASCAPAMVIGGLRMTTVLKHVGSVVPITVRTSQITLRNIAINICGPAKEFLGSGRDAKRLATHVKELKQFDLVTTMTLHNDYFYD